MTANPIFVLVVSHESGENISLHSTEALANTALVAYVQENWEQECDEDAPEDVDEMVQFYFNSEFSRAMENESYEISPCVVDEVYEHAQPGGLI